MTQISPIFVLHIQIFDGNLARTSVRGLARGNGLHSGLLIVMHQWVWEPMGSHGLEVHPLLFFFWALRFENLTFSLLLPLLPHSAILLPCSIEGWNVFERRQQWQQQQNRDLSTCVPTPSETMLRTNHQSRPAGHSNPTHGPLWTRECLIFVFLPLLKFSGRLAIKLEGC